MKNLTLKKITLALSVFVVSLLFLSSANTSKAATWLCDDSAGVANTIYELCPIAGVPTLCTTLDGDTTGCADGWECNTPSCLAECNFADGRNCPTPPGIPPGPGCTSSEYIVCGCTCPGGGGGGGGTTIGCAIPAGDADGDGNDCDYSLGENMFNCTTDCLPVGVPDKLIPDVIDDAVSWLLKFAIAISVLALIYGGTCYVFSSGDMQKTENARKIVKYALLGIFIAGISFAIITIIDEVFH